MNAAGTPIRSIVVVACVLALHVAALWALDHGLHARKSKTVVPIQMLAQLITPAQPAARLPAPPPPVANTAPPPAPLPPRPTARTAAVRPPLAKPAPVPEPEPRPALTRAPTPVSAASTTPTRFPTPAATDPAPAQQIASAATPTSGDYEKPAPAPVAATTNASATVAPSVAVAPAPPAPTSVPVELPSSDARYLHNPKPRYPPISLRLREQGTVLLKVLVSEQGQAKEVEIKTSSGSYRLDNAALSTVQTWRFVPGKRNGTPHAMWFTLPISFEIQ